MRCKCVVVVVLVVMVSVVVVLCVLWLLCVQCECLALDHINFVVSFPLTSLNVKTNANFDCDL